MEALMTREILAQEGWTEELCGSCRRRILGAYCPEYGRVMPADVPACHKWEGDDDDAA